jgi:hypothetical protein
MRNADHPLERQSKVLTAFRDDEKYNTLRVGAEYDSVEQHWKRIWKDAVREEFRCPPPVLEEWDSTEFAWERFNNACLIPTEKCNALIRDKRSKYFQPLRTPVWDSENVLFEPPPFITCDHNWQNIIGGFRFADCRPQQMTYKEYRRYTNGWDERHFKAEKERAANYLATVVNGIAPLPKGIVQDRKSKYFEPMQRPVWKFEKVMFDG